MNESWTGPADNRPYYVAVWRSVLEGWLRWPKERVDRFILNHDDDLNDRSEYSLFYHEDELYYVIPRLIPSHLKLEIRAYYKLQDSIKQAIWPSFEAQRDPEFDWEAAKSRVEAVLASHDAALPGPEDIPDFLRKWLGEESQETINGNAELVVQDAASYQKLTKFTEEARVLEGIRKGIEEMKAGLGRPAKEVFDEIRNDLDI